MVIHHHKIDMIPGGVPTVVHVSQYDEDFRIEFQLYWSGGHARSYNSTPTAKVYGTKLDGNGYSADCTVTGGSPLVVIVEGDEQMTAIAGKNIFELALFDPNSGRKTHSSNFILQVEPAALDGNTIVSESVVDEIDKFLEYHPEYFTDAVDDIIIVDDDQPESERNKLWIRQTEADPVQIPTYEEFQRLSDIVDTLPIDEEAIHDYIDSHPELVSDFILSASSDGNGNVTLHLYGGD